MVGRSTHPQPLGVLMRPRYLQIDFVLVTLGVIVAALIAIWATELGVDRAYAIVGFVAALWLLLDVLHRRLIKEGMTWSEEAHVRRRSDA